MLSTARRRASASVSGGCIYTCPKLNCRRRPCGPRRTRVRLGISLRTFEQPRNQCWPRDVHFELGNVGCPSGIMVTVNLFHASPKNVAGKSDLGREWREKRINEPPPQPTLPAVRHAILELIARLPPRRCPHYRNGFATSSGVSKSAKVVLGGVLINPAALKQWFEYRDSAWQIHRHQTGSTTCPQNGSQVQKERDHDGFPEDGLSGLHRTSSSARSRQPVRPRLSRQRDSLRAAAWISGQLAHL